MENQLRLRQFIGDFTRLLERCGNDEPAMFGHGGRLPAALVGADDRPSISIHVYGASIGAVSRHLFGPVTGAPTPFASGYLATSLPDFRDRPAAVRAALGA